MRFPCSGALAVCVRAGIVTAGNAADKDPQASIVFPEVLRRSEYAFLPLGEFAMDKELVREVNSLQSKREQVRFLYRQLPAKDAKDKRLNERQFSAVFLLGLSGAPWVAPALVDRLEFTGEAYMDVVMVAIVPLGELAIEPLVQSLQNDNDLQNNMACLMLREIKGDAFPAFVENVLKRKDLKLPASAVWNLETAAEPRTQDEA
jgi:hypothetical protein